MTYIGCQYQFAAGGFSRRFRMTRRLPRWFCAVEMSFFAISFVQGLVLLFLFEKMAK